MVIVRRLSPKSLLRRFAAGSAATHFLYAIASLGLLTSARRQRENGVLTHDSGTAGWQALLAETGEALLWPGGGDLDEEARLELSRRLERIVETQRDIATADLDLDAVMSLICERTQELIGSHSAAVLLSDGSTLRYGAATGYMQDKVGETFPLRSLSGWTLFNNTSAMTGDAMHDPRTHNETARRNGTQSLIVVPLRHGDHPVGLLQVSSTDPDAFDEGDVQLLDLLSVVLSAAMSHASEFEAKRAQVEALTRFEVIYRDSPIGVGIVGLDGKFVDANAAMLDILGYSLEEVTSKYVSDYTHADDADEVAAQFKRLIEGEHDSYRTETRHFHKNGNVVWTQSSVSAVRDSDGATTFAIVMSQDVTQQKLAELALRESNRRLERIVETQRDIANAGLELDGIMRLMAERAQTLTGADGAMVNLLEGEDLVTHAAIGIDARVVGYTRPLEQTLTSHAIECGHALLVEHPQEDARLYQPPAKSIESGSHVCVPLFQSGRGFGSLTVTSASGAASLTEHDRRTMELLGVVLSSALSRAAEFEAKRQQVEALARFETTYQGAPIGIAMVDLRGRAIESNPALQEILGYSGEELARMHVSTWTHPEDQPVVDTFFREVISGQRDSYRVEERFIRKDGQLVWANVYASLVRDQDGRPRFLVAMAEDITKRKAAEEAFLRQAELNEHQARHDALTGLVNRVYFRDRIETAIQQAKRYGGEVAVLMMDLDRFKEVNDSLGHHAGDTLLKELGTRLQTLVRASDSFARLGGDEFGLLLPRPAGTEQIVRVIERIRELVERPIVVQGLPLTVEASIGVSLYPEHGDDVDTLLQRADVAMYIAKEENSAYAFYDEDADNYDPARLTLVGELRRAIEERELELFYQPVVALATGRVRSVEALLRWHHPQRGLVPPDEFIPVAQQTGLIKPLTLYVIERALEQCRRWRDEGIELPVAVNLSTRNLLDLEFPDQVEQLIERWGVDPVLLEFEITESTMLADPVRTKDVLQRLSALGIRLAIDDFGSGYSSLAYLKRLPVHEIKIDRSFVVNMSTDDDDATIVRSTIDLGRNLGLDVVAEGVETQATWERLEQLGCTAAQGYHMSPALPAQEFISWLSARGG